MPLGDYEKTTYNEGAAPGISAIRLNNNEDKTEELDNELASHEDEKATEEELGHVKVDGISIIADENGVVSVVEQMLSADTIYYVNITRPDNSGDGLSQATAFKNIQYAINQIPKHLVGNATIRVLAGNYSSESQLVIEKFYGSGLLTLTGYTGTADVATLAEADNYIIEAILVKYCTNTNVTVRGLSTNYTGTAYKAFEMYIANKGVFSLCKDIVNVSRVGFGFQSTMGQISSCQASYKSIACLATYWSVVLSADWTAGTGNTVGLSCRDGSTIGKKNTQPQGTTAQETTNGGEIR